MCRSCFLDATEQIRINRFSDYCPCTDATARAYGDGTGPGPQGDDSYRLYFGVGWRKAPWNENAVANIARKVLEEAALDQLPPLTAEQVQATLWDLVKQAQNSWKQNKPRVVVAADGRDYVEGKVEAEARAQAQAAHRARRQLIHTRKQTVSALMNNVSFFISLLSITACSEVYRSTSCHCAATRRCSRHHLTSSGPNCFAEMGDD